ncbi:hypothetical protein TMatcc_002230 [Talaromyces marneffei ATCC 18224]|uniref:uncharacterized protein n=1 Tax=Talaromyces marneffei TaxID=37727 RepID=UPI0012A9359A|nr:uncharacterized protein EYB26_006600 [Talaromyces marneffei]QGA18915.1 hypothetical protein EYB26_006600 [Talaromyces marneffei]
MCTRQRSDGHLSANVDFKRTPILNFLQAQNHISQISGISNFASSGYVSYDAQSKIIKRSPAICAALDGIYSGHFTFPIRYIVWAFFGAFAIWSGISGIAGSATGQLKPRDAIVNGTNSSWESFAIVEVMYPSAAHFIYRHDWIGLLIQIVTQSFIVLGLHCIELITNISRDESCWRKAAAVGVEMKGSATTTFTTSWQSMTCKILKSITQWVFGKAFTADISVIMSLFLLVTMTDLFLLSYIFTEYLIRRKPKGYQPVTYGDICRLARYIDEWDETRIFWGDKGEIGNGTRRAGTAGHRLCDIQPDTLYIGLA